MSQDDVALLNSRGRKVVVKKPDVRNLLIQGFTYPPEDSKEQDYNPVYDKGVSEPSRIKEEKQTVITPKRLGDVLSVEQV